MRKRVDPTGLAFTLTFYLFLLSHVSDAQIIRTCTDNRLQPNFCAVSCGTHPISACQPINGFTVCACNSNCYNGAVAPPPVPLGNNCPLATDPPSGAVLNTCQGLCPMVCAGGTAQVCGDPTLGGPPLIARVCGCVCPPTQCPTTPVPPTTTTTTTTPSPTSAQPSTAVFNGAGFLLIPAFIAKMKFFLSKFIKIYGILFFVGKIIVAQMLALGGLAFFLLISQIDFPRLVFDITQGITPNIFRLG